MIIEEGVEAERETVGEIEEVTDDDHEVTVEIRIGVCVFHYYTVCMLVIVCFIEIGPLLLAEEMTTAVALEAETEDLRVAEAEADLKDMYYQ